MPDTRQRGKQPRTTCPTCGRDVAHSFSVYGPLGYAMFRHLGTDGRRCPQRWVWLAR